MHDMFDAFQTASAARAERLEVYLNRSLGGLEYLMFTKEEHDTDLTTHPVFAFDLSQPFEDQFPIRYIKSVETIDDILEAFEEIEFENGEVDPNAEMSPEALQHTLSRIIPSPFSDKFQQLERKFEEARDSDEPFQFCYIYLNNVDELEFITTSQPHTTEVMSKSLAGIRIVAAFDLEDNFESQIRACSFCPEQPVTWYDLIYYPVDCVSGKMQSLLPAPEPTTVVPIKFPPPNR